MGERTEKVVEFKYDLFQQQAIDYINDGNSVIVSAPTGAGKTAIAQHLIRECIKRNDKVIYTAPIKALSNQKFREFEALVPGDVGIMTGDITLNPDASVLIMTTEIFRNKLLEDKSSLERFTWIIFDEIHYLDDFDRGTVWEESLIFMPDHMNFVGLSATVPNVDQIKDWLESIHHKPVKIVKESNRPVPLHFAYQCQGKVFDSIDEMGRVGYRSIDGRHYRGNRISRSVHLRANQVIDLIKHIEDQDMLPCIYFTFSRKRTELLAEEMAEFNFVTKEERQKLQEMFDELCERYDLKHDPKIYKIRPLISRGIGYHHAGMLPTIKEVIEQLFTSRLLKVIFTTETFAIGINMPARSVCFDDLSKYDGQGFGLLRTRDFYQMAGRAGRRSIDTEGFVFLRVNPHFVGCTDLQRIVYSPPEKVQSQFNASYATVLNLYTVYKDRLHEIYPKSLHYFQTRKYHHKRALYQLKAKLDILKELGYIHKGQLTEQGEFASHVYGYELMLGELYVNGIIDKLPVEQLGILLLAIVYEPRKGTSKGKLDPMTKELERLANKIYRRIQHTEKFAGIGPQTKKCFFHMTPLMEEWIRQADFNDIVALTDADEGEIVRYLRMTIQLLRQMLDADISDQLREKVKTLMRLINRDVIDTEKQLRA